MRVANEGPENARLVIVGPFPASRNETYYLNRALAGAGLARRECLRTNVVDFVPPAEHWENHAAAEIESGAGRLRVLLERLQPELVLCLGEQARQAVLSGMPNARPPRKQTIFETRGYPFVGIHGGTALATVHPASFLYGGWIPFAPLFEWDVRKAANFLRGSFSGSRASRFEAVARSMDELGQLAEHCRTAQALSLDIEEDTVISFAWNRELGVAVPDYTHEPARSFVAEILASPVPKITMNGAKGLYDSTRLEGLGFTVTNAAYDLMLMWHAIEPILAGKKKESGDRTEKSLRFFGSLFCWEAFWKNYAFESIEQEWTLCAKDARIQFEVWESLNARLT